MNHSRPSSALKGTQIVKHFSPFPGDHSISTVRQETGRCGRTALPTTTIRPAAEEMSNNQERVGELNVGKWGIFNPFGGVGQSRRAAEGWAAAISHSCGRLAHGAKSAN